MFMLQRMPSRPDARLRSCSQETLNPLGIVIKRDTSESEVAVFGACPAVASSASCALIRSLLPTRCVV